jgi:hypothetical protein
LPSPEDKSKTAEPAARGLWFTREALLAAFRRGGCPVCQAVASSERQSIWSFLYEGMMSPLVRQDFLRGGGFCPRHFEMAKHIEAETWQTGGIGMAILCEQLLKQSEQALLQENEPRANRLQIRKRDSHPRFAAGHGCLFCRENSRKEQALVEVLEELTGEKEYASLLSRNAFCLRHGQLALAEWKIPEKKTWLQELMLRHIGELMGDLRIFIEKHDYNRRGEPLGREADAVERAARVIAGAEMVAAERGGSRRENPAHLRRAR